MFQNWTNVQMCFNDRFIGGGRALIDKGSRTFLRDIDIWKVQNVSDTCDSIFWRLPVDIFPWIRLTSERNSSMVDYEYIVLIFFKKCIVSWKNNMYIWYFAITSIVIWLETKGIASNFETHCTLIITKL